jgi:hypothetical protein
LGNAYPLQKVCQESSAIAEWCAVAMGVRPQSLCHQIGVQMQGGDGITDNACEMIAVQSSSG